MTQARDIIVIGASLGGLDALCRITSRLPSNLPAAILIVLHTSPQGTRLLAEMVGQCTPLSVSYGRQGERIKPRHV
jgi:two-component system chemotaxis response regulator CheB